MGCLLCDMSFLLYTLILSAHLLTRVCCVYICVVRWNVVLFFYVVTLNYCRTSGSSVGAR
jgi:hypothetical protein